MSIVLFGLEGPFSRVVLSALAATELRPSLVVVGSSSRVPAVRRVGDRPGFLSRMIGIKALDSALGEQARSAGIAAIEVTDPGDPRARQLIANAAPEVLVVAGFHRLLSRDVLALAPRGGLNLHPGRLPEERGPAPLFWALKEGRTRHTFSIHVLDEGEDTGDVVSTGGYDVPPGHDGQEILERCARAALPQLMRAIRDLRRGELVRIKQDQSRAARRGRPKLEDGRIDVRRTAEEVFTFVAGCAKHYVVFAECAGDRFFVRGAESYDLSASLPYDFVLAGDRLILRTSPGVVELVLAPDGAMFAADYVA
ncbi:MAG: hypothetical protein HYV07_07835 [Deltaproteobacteria bacterium]|nr:hypothetical protein [Deltaproteobacteria bacterium]